jgi:hypothetical protein
MGEVGGERYRGQRSASGGRVLGMVEAPEEARIRSERGEDLEEVHRFLQLSGTEVDLTVLCKFLEFDEMGEAQQVERSLNSAAS